MRRLTWRIPNVALAHPVELAEERRSAPAKRSGLVNMPHGATLDGVEWLTGPDGSRWRIEVLLDGEVIAHEV